MTNLSIYFDRTIDQVSENFLAEFMAKLIEYGSTKGLYIKDGRVYNSDGYFAIAYSSGFGAGWSTWSNIPEAVYSPPAVLLSLLLEQYDDHIDAFAELFKVYLADSINEGTLNPDEYDGNESVEYDHSVSWSY